MGQQLLVQLGSAVTYMAYHNSIVMVYGQSQTLV